MPQIVQQGSFNAASVNVPDLYTIIVPPSGGGISGASINLIGISGAASWGPVNVATSFADAPSLLAAFGPVAVRKYDLATVAATAIANGGAAFYGVRVSDGTDVAASVTLTANELAKAPAFYAALAAAVNSGVGVNRNASALATFNATTGVISAAYTGIVGNSTKVTITNGSKTGTFRAVIQNSLVNPKGEIFDNIPAAAGAAPTLMAYSQAGGTDGATGLNGAMVAGSNALTPPTGIYALHGRGCAVAAAADCDDSTQWEALAEWAYAEGIVVCVAGPSGETIASAMASKAAAGVDDYDMKVLLGDYVYFYDAQNVVTRLVSPQGFWLGLRASLSPNDSSLNKQLYSVAGTAHSGQVSSGSLSQFTGADVQNLVNAGIDCICNPLPGGAYWGFRVGHNSSSDSTRNGENYSMMTFFLAKSINGAMGRYVGKPISPTLVNMAFADLSSFCSNLVSLGLIGTLDGSPAFQVVCGASNNPSAMTGKGYLQAKVNVVLQGINEEFLISLEDGATVSIGS